MYIVDDYVEFETAEEAAEYIIDHLNDEPYDDMLDELYGEIDICGYSYFASVALYKLDEIAYRCGKNDYYDSLCYDLTDDIERMYDGEELTYYDFHIIYSEDEEEEEDE